MLMVCKFAIFFASKLLIRRLFSFAVYNRFWPERQHSKSDRFADARDAQSLEQAARGARRRRHSLPRLLHPTLPRQLHNGRAEFVVPPPLLCD